MWVYALCMCLRLNGHKHSQENNNPHNQFVNKFNAHKNHHHMLFNIYIYIYNWYLTVNVHVIDFSVMLFIVFSSISLKLYGSK